MPLIASLVNSLLDKISDVNIPIAENKTLNLVEDLKKTPRTGKAIRIEKFNLNLPKRSIYDHIISLGYQADTYLQMTNLKINNDEVACLIAFHDLAESIIGDVPDFTEKVLAGELHQTTQIKNKLENEANKLIEKSIPEDLRDNFTKTINDYKENISSEVKFFNMVDKTDPILAIWRYLSTFRKQIYFPNYQNAMKDFFTNPEVSKCCLNNKIKSMVKFLQNIENAKSYHLKGSEFLQTIENEKMSEYLRLLIENRDMHIV